MSDTTPETPENPVDPTPEAGAQPEELGDGGKKALADERKARRDAEKQLKEALASLDGLNQKVKSFEDANKTEDQKKVDRIAELERLLAEKDTQLSKKDQDILRRDIAKDKGVPVNLVTGSTREEMEAAADDALEWRGSEKEKKPVGAFRSGASTTSVTDPKQRAAEAIRAMWNAK